jgi:phosphate transport system substrate-binding protein
MMRTSESIAFARLVAVAGLFALLSMFACRPEWSPDGKKLLFTGRDDQGLFVAAYDRETGKAERLHQRYAHSSMTGVWSPDGKRAVVISGPSPQGMAVTVVSVPPVGDPLVFEVSSGKDQQPVPIAVMSAVAVGDYLFMNSEGLVRIDLKTRETKLVRAKNRQGVIAVMPRGDGLCCVEIELAKDLWIIDVLDPVTLQRTPLLKSADLPGVDVTPMPVFSKDLARIAMPSGKKNEILVFRDGKLEATVPLGEEGVAQVHSIVMPRDGAEIYATVCRSLGDWKFGWSLVEGTIGGAIVREKRLFTADVEPLVGQPMGMPGVGLGLSISPDGQVGAVSTCFTPEVHTEKGALYLIDLVGRQRTVTRVPFPLARPVTIQGSDLMLKLAERWAKDFFDADDQGFGLDNPNDQKLIVRGGGSGAGLTALIEGKCGAAMTTRKAEQSEIDVAKKRNVALEEHVIVQYGITLCVHEKNKLASLTKQQVAQIFGPSGVTKWSELGVKMPKGMDEIRVTLLAGDPMVRSHRRSVLLGGAKMGKHVKLLASGEELFQFARDTPNAIVCFDKGRTWGGSPGVNNVALQEDAKSPSILPTKDTIANGKYPLISGLYVYSRQGGSKNAQDFLGWLRGSAGAYSTEKAGF